MSRSKIGFFLFSTLLIWQYGQFPGKRFPNWDYSWVDSMNISRISELQNSLQNFQIPEMNFFAGLGLEKLSEVSGYLNPINPLHLLLFLNINPEQYILIKTCLFLSILQIGTYYLILDFTNKKNISTTTALIAPTLPIYTSMIYPFSTTFCFACSIPMIIYLYTRYMQSQKIRYLAYYFLLLLSIGPDLLTTGTLVILNLAFLPKIKELIRGKIKKFSLFSLTGCLGTITFWYPYLFLLQNRQERLSILEITQDRNLTFFDYWKAILLNGAHTLLYPIEGSGIQMYTPLFLIVTITGYIFTRNKYPKMVNGEINKLLLLILKIGILPSLLYLHPITSTYISSIFRTNFTLLPILFLIIGSLVISEISTKKFILILASSVGIELALFIFDPFTRLKDSLPHGDVIAQTLGTSHPILSSNLENTLKLSLPFLTSKPWLNLMIANLFILLLLRFNTKIENFKLKQTYLLLSVAVAFFSFSSGIELRKYMSNSQQVSVSDYRFANYENRVTKWINQYQINGANYRVLLAGKEFYENSGRNIKISIDSELGNLYGIKTIPQYRELDNIDMGLNLFKIKCPNCSSAQGESLGANFPITINQLNRNSNWIFENSVKYVLTADEQIKSEKFVLLDKYQYPFIFYGYDETENGTVYLYEFKNPKPIVTSMSGDKDIKNLEISSTGIDLHYVGTIQTKIDINYYFNEGFSATYQGREIAITKTPDYKMSISIPKGNGKLELRFHNSKVREAVMIQFFMIMFYFFLRIRKKIKIG